MARKKKNTNEENPEQTPETPGDEQASGEVMVGLTMEEMDALQKSIDEAEAKAAAYKTQADDAREQMQRALADFANLKRRMERDQAQMKDNATGQVVLPFLTVLDDLDLALRNRPLEGEGAAWASGIELIYRKVKNALELQGVRTMQVEGEFFDPNFHEAITQEASPDHESGQIIGVVRPGYLIGDRVLRPAMVRVAA